MILSKFEKEWLNNTENKKEMLGQIFTPVDVANLMVSIAIDSKPKTILDPCFGEGIFIKSINRRVKDNSIKIKGVEIDPVLYKKVKESLIGLNIDLYNMDFFDVKDKVDCIIMNPPYIRQELLNGDLPKFLNKEKIRERLSLTNSIISSRSNLYIYFFIKALELLNFNGEIIAIIPNTWMAAEYGQSFKEFLINNFWIKSIIYFNKDVFPDADVDSCIIHLSKNLNSISTPTNLIYIKHELSNNEIDSFYSLLQNNNKKVSVIKITSEELKYKNNWLTLINEGIHIDFMENMISFNKIAKIKRGLTTNYNELFICNDSELINQFPNYFKQIVCSPKDIEGYSTKFLNKKSFVLLTQCCKNDLPLELRRYLDKYEKAILNSKRPKTLYNKIISHPTNWFNLKKTEGSMFIFSYIIRNQKKFILNESELIARDNFYEISPISNINKYLLFAILNSRITELFLENIGRSHGKGLLKIQKYELDNLLIINPYIINKNDVVLLEGKSKKILSSNKVKASDISEIDKILLPYISTKLTVQDIEKMLGKKIETRFNKKNGYLKLVKEV